METEVQNQPAVEFTTLETDNCTGIIKLAQWIFFAFIHQLPRWEGTELAKPNTQLLESGAKHFCIEVKPTTDFIFLLVVSGPRCSPNDQYRTLSDLSITTSVIIYFDKFVVHVLLGNRQWVYILLVNINELIIDSVPFFFTVRAADVMFLVLTSIQSNCQSSTRLFHAKKFRITLWKTRKYFSIQPIQKAV